ncbi:MAG: DNA-methyltransferase [Halanaerobiales bacterium]
MKDIILDKNKNALYYETNNFCLLNGDTLELLSEIKSSSIDMIFADPPYFLSNDGITCKSGKMVSVNKGEWDKSEGIQEIHNFNLEWIKECKRVLNDDGTIWISGTYHNIYSLGMALLKYEYKILNNVVWFKTNPPPNLGCRCLTHSNETIIWAKKSEKSKHCFNYKLMKEMNNNRQMKDVWRIGQVSKAEKKFGKHPTQKPLELLKRIVQASTEKDMTILDPFNGSGTTGIAAVELGRNYIGIDMEKEYLDQTINRYEDHTKNLKMF